MIDRAGQIWSSISRSAFVGGPTTVRTIFILSTVDDGNLWKHKSLVTISNGHTTACDVMEAWDCLLDNNPNWKRL